MASAKHVGRVYESRAADSTWGTGDVTYGEAKLPGPKRETRIVGIPARIGMGERASCRAVMN
jgi:hypothetical protein